MLETSDEISSKRPNITKYKNKLKLIARVLRELYYFSSFRRCLLCREPRWHSHFSLRYISMTSLIFRCAKLNPFSVVRARREASRGVIDSLFSFLCRAQPEPLQRKAPFTTKGNTALCVGLVAAQRARSIMLS